MKTQKASDSFVWAGFGRSVTSLALTFQLHLGLISHVLQDLSHKAFPKRVLRNRVPLKGNSHAAKYFWEKHDTFFQDSKIKKERLGYVRNPRSLMEGMET